MALELAEDDTIVIGKRVVVDGEVRYLAKAVESRELTRPLIGLVLETANLQQFIDDMGGEVEKARLEANKSQESAKQAHEQQEQAGEYSAASQRHSQESKRQADLAAGSVGAAAAEVEKAANQANTAGNHSDDANASKLKAQEYTEVCEAYAAGMVSILTSQVVAMTHVLRMDGIK